MVVGVTVGGMWRGGGADWFWELTSTGVSATQCAETYEILAQGRWDLWSGAGLVVMYMDRIAKGRDAFGRALLGAYRVGGQGAFQGGVERYAPYRVHWRRPRPQKKDN